MENILELRCELVATAKVHMRSPTLMYPGLVSNFFYTIILLYICYSVHKCISIQFFYTMIIIYCYNWCIKFIR